MIDVVLLSHTTGNDNQEHHYTDLDQTVAMTPTYKKTEILRWNANKKKYASCPDWRNRHMPIAVTASGGQFVTRASRLPDQFVAPG